MKKLLIFLAIVPGLILAACGSAQSRISSNPEIPSVEPESTSAQPQPAPAYLAMTDNQGAVEITIQPIILDDPGDALTFEVSMNTHSVDLSMDLADLVTLITDNGNTVKGLSWDGPRGGHHVSGTLTFPASIGGKSILDGASKISLTISNIDAPERIFTWDLAK